MKLNQKLTKAQRTQLSAALEISEISGNGKPLAAACDQIGLRPQARDEVTLRRLAWGMSLDEATADL